MSALYKITDWPLGEGETEDGSYPYVSTFTDRDQAIDRARELLIDYTEGRASVECDAQGHGSRPSLTDYTEAAIELGRFDETPDYYGKPWELDTAHEAVFLTIEKRKD